MRDELLTWYRIELSKDALGRGEHIKLEQRFRTVWLTAGQPEGMALASLQQKPWVFFVTPYGGEFCPDLLNDYSAEPCGSPERTELSLPCCKFSDLDFWFA